MKKRSIALMMALAMAGSMVGCGSLSVGGSDQTTAAKTEAKAEGETKAEGEAAAKTDGGFPTKTIEVIVLSEQAAALTLLPVSSVLTWSRNWVRPLLSTM
ncbi:hypothetical protein [Clostridium sp. AM58-1XD]|uniref:hypothetical protein n=1 Tax=Clostridium sp. AM58-1XD TaxID=2292307 RepID=UPI000E486E2E|nr:hypothetical protein [Clostridium sp. AM58-1XD]RGY97254.1 hypothetical protein DXA13_15040 [Clostridium sp. AM58-1XD]